MSRKRKAAWAVGRKVVDAVSNEDRMYDLNVWSKLQENP